MATTELSDVIGDWVKSRRAAGVAPHDVLEALGLQVSQEAAVDESALWAMVALLVEEHRQRAQPRRRLATADGLTAVVDLVRREFDQRAHIDGRSRPLPSFRRRRRRRTGSLALTPRYGKAFSQPL